MMIESFHRDGDRKAQVLVDNIREVSISDDLITYIKCDDTEDVFVTNEESVHSVYLLNDEGKTIKILKRASK